MRLSLAIITSLLFGSYVVAIPTRGNGNSDRESSGSPPNPSSSSSGYPSHSPGPPSPFSHPEEPDTNPFFPSNPRFDEEFGSQQIPHPGPYHVGQTLAPLPPVDHRQRNVIIPERVPATGPERSRPQRGLSRFSPYPRGSPGPSEPPPVGRGRGPPFAPLFVASLPQGRARTLRHPRPHVIQPQPDPNGPTLYSCQGRDNCRYSNDKTNFERHQKMDLIHNPEKQFRCSFPDCDKSYTRPDALKRHKDNKNHHPS
ncbi:hypothetical protein F5887DRAFT_477644 [Amanita rubescens]|nr:hypothetical protein F5887DRAFT_477644 [Amanita rubescens]